MKMTGSHNVKLHEDSPIIVATTSRNYFYVQVKDFYREIIISFYVLDGFEWQYLAWYKDGKRRLWSWFFYSAKQIQKIIDLKGTW